MEKLFETNFGLMLWTVVTFTLLLIVLAKFGWKPLIESIQAREEYLREERRAAEAARAEALRIQKELESRLAEIEAKSRAALAQAASEGSALRAQMKSTAEADAKKIRDKTLAELAEEKRRLVAELRGEVAGLSVLAAEKLVRQSVNEQVKKNVMDAFFKDLEKQKGHAGA